MQILGQICHLILQSGGNFWTDDSCFTRLLIWNKKFMVYTKIQKVLMGLLIAHRKFYWFAGTFILQSKLLKKFWFPESLLIYFFFIYFLYLYFSFTLFSCRYPFAVTQHFTTDAVFPISATYYSWKSPPIPGKPKKPI